MNIVRRISNIIHSSGWSLGLKSFGVSRGVLRQGDLVTIDGIIYNNGFKIGTVYVQIIIANPYNHRNEIFNTHIDLSLNEKHKLRIVDILPNNISTFSFIWTIPKDTPIGVYDIKIIIWSAPKLYDKKSAMIMDKSPWKGAIEILENVNNTIDDNPQPYVFISYSWDSDKHRNWVIKLAEELVKNGINIMIDCWDLHPGEDLFQFMERGCRDSSKIIIVVTENYTIKANNREGGVGVETVINAALYAKSKNKKRFIPIIRCEDYKSKVSLPTYLESALFLNFSGPDWKSKPFSELLRAVYEEYEFKRPSLGTKPKFE